MRSLVVAKSKTSTWLNSLHPKAKLVEFDQPSNLCAFFKPVGMLSHPNKPNEFNNCLFREKYNFESECYRISTTEVDEKPEKVYLINRLDSSTSGLILASPSLSTSNAVKKCFKLKTQVAKIYYAICFLSVNDRFPLQTEFNWQDNLIVKHRVGYVRAEEFNGDKTDPKESTESLTKAKIVRVSPFALQGVNDVRLCLVQLEPVTGLSHQLRHQCAKRGLPIVGDKVYGNFALNKSFLKSVPQLLDLQNFHKENSPQLADPTPNVALPSLFSAEILVATSNPLRRLYLHSSQIDVNFTKKGEEHCFSARSPLPDEFEYVMEGNQTKIVLTPKQEAIKTPTSKSRKDKTNSKVEKG